MLPFALKVVWFVLSSTGTIVCWVVLTIFGRVIGIRWGSALYCVLATALQGIFCLGMIWEMDPYKMPRGFCIAQTLITYYSAYSLTGFCAGFTVATTGWVLWPSTMVNLGRPVLGYHHKECVFLLGFPLACTAIAVPVLFKLDAIQPADGMACDASYPLWTRFLGYAGLPLLLSIPSFFLSAAAVVRVRRIHLRSRSFSVFKSKRDELPSVVEFAPPSFVQTQLVVTEPPPESDSVTVPIPYAGEVEKILMPSLIDTMLGSAGREEAPSGASSSSPHIFPTTFSDMLRLEHAVGSEPNDEEMMRSQRPDTTVPSFSIGRVGPSLEPAIWRLLLFQMSFFFIEILAALSTIIDVARHRTTPSPFGSQYIALILVVWGPLLVFGPLPSVKQHLLFWRRPRP